MSLSNLLVVELAGVLAGPSVGMFLAELGARVVKIENPATGGDVTRGWTLGESTIGAGRPSPYFAAVNWGKESVALDFRLPERQEVARRLCARADVVLVSYKRGDAARFGLDYDAVAEANPAVVYGEITAYGPDDDRIGYDAIIQAATGFTHLNGSPEGPPTRLPVALMDVLAGHQLKQGVLLGLLQRERTGRGTKVSVSLLRAGLAGLINQASNWLVGGVNPRRLGSGHPNIVPYGNSYPTRDGTRVVLAVGSDGQFADLCDVLGVAGLAADSRFASNPCRVRHRGELEGVLTQRLAEVDAAAFLRACEQRGVPAGPILDVREALSRPSADPMLLVARDGPEELKGLRSVAFEPGEAYRPLDLSPPPRLGEHTETVLSELGLATGGPFQRRSE